MKQYFKPEFELVAYSYPDDVCDGSFIGDSSNLSGTIPSDWEYGDE